MGVFNFLCLNWYFLGVDISYGPSHTVNARFEEADNEVVKIRSWLDDRKKEAEELAQEERLQFEENFIKPSWNCKWSSKLRRLANTCFTPTRQATSKLSYRNW